MRPEEQERNNVFHERVSILRNHGYRGFTITKVRKEWDGVQVTAQNGSGKTITASGDTNMEAYKKIIDNIDLILDQSI